MVPDKVKVAGILIFILAGMSCNHHVGTRLDWETDSVAIKQLTPPELMEALLPDVIRYAGSDTARFYSDDVMARRFPDLYFSGTCGYHDGWGWMSSAVYDDNQILVIGRIIDDHHILAITYTACDSVVGFYRLDHDQWKMIGRHLAQIPVEVIYAEEFNAEPGLEIVLSTTWNMNGNSWKELCYYAPEKDTITFAGNFSTSYEVNLNDTTVHEEYYGSWYMDVHKTFYIWNKNMLVPVRQAVIITPETFGTDEKGILKYYENPSREYYPGLQLVFSDSLDKDDSRKKEYWDDFFIFRK